MADVTRCDLCGTAVVMLTWYQFTDPGVTVVVATAPYRITELAEFAYAMASTK
jgi:hypothetical protein